MTNRLLLRSLSRGPPGCPHFARSPRRVSSSHSARSFRRAAQQPLRHASHSPGLVTPDGSAGQRAVAYSAGKVVRTLHAFDYAQRVALPGAQGVRAAIRSRNRLERFRRGRSERTGMCVRGSEHSLRTRKRGGQKHARSASARSAMARRRGRVSTLRRVRTSWTPRTHRSPASSRRKRSAH